jgi:hypothetical protein
MACCSYAYHCDECSKGCLAERLIIKQDKLKALRKFRDEVLSQTPEGQEIIKLYYELSPVIVEMMEEDEEFKEEVREMIDGILLELNLSKLIEDT